MKRTILTYFAVLVLMQLSEARYASVNLNLAMTVSEDAHQLSEDMVRICAQETKISMEELHQFRQHDFSTSSESTQCFAHCMYEQMGLMHNGVFVERDIIHTMSDVTDPKAMLLYRECHALRGANKCETAYKIHRCRQEKNGGSSNTTESDEKIKTTSAPNTSTDALE